MEIATVEQAADLFARYANVSNSPKELLDQGLDAPNEFRMHNAEFQVLTQCLVAFDLMRKHHGLPPNTIQIIS